MDHAHGVYLHHHRQVRLMAQTHGTISNFLSRHASSFASVSTGLGTQAATCAAYHSAHRPCPVRNWLSNDCTVREIETRLSDSWVCYKNMTACMTMEANCEDSLHCIIGLLQFSSSCRPMGSVEGRETRMIKYVWMFWPFIINCLPSTTWFFDVCLAVQFSQELCHVTGWIV